MGVGLASLRADAAIGIASPGSERGLAAAVQRYELVGTRFLELDDPDAALAGIDLLLFVARAGDAADRERTLRAADAARGRGIPIVALIAGDAAPAAPLLATLRDAAEMLMLIRDPAAIPEILAALR